jgi:cephalosporin hydroxylase
MKRVILIWISLFQFLWANGDVTALKQRIFSHLPTIEGWCSKEKALNFIDLILTERPKTWVEIGVFGGSSLFPVASTFKFLGEGTVFAIDAWDKLECLKHLDPMKDAAHLKWWGGLNITFIYNSYLNMLKKHKLEDCCITIKDTSERAASQIDEIDVLHLDGNHTEIVSTLDVLLYLPKVRSGGYIWFNDSLWEERQQAIELLLEACDTIKVIDNGNCILFKKR